MLIARESTLLAPRSTLPLLLVMEKVDVHM
jgi:hypothetical protein